MSAKHDFDKLLAFMERLPAIRLPAGRKSIGLGSFPNGNWWAKFSLDTIHPLAWRHVQELGHVLNYVSVQERLPTVFMPVSPPSYLNGGAEFLSWVIESTDPSFTPDNCVEWLEGRLPRPVDNLSQWRTEDDEDVESKLARHHAMSDRTNKVTLELEQHEALVLLDLLERVGGDDQSVRIEHPAEASILCDLCCMLEARLVPPLSSNYVELLAAARRRVLGTGDDAAG